MQLGLLLQVTFELFQEMIVVAYQLQVGFDALPRADLLKSIEDVSIAGVLQHLLERIEVVLLVDQLNVRQKLATASHQECSAAEQVAGGPHLLRIDVALRESATAQQSSDLLAVELVVLVFSSMNSLHVKSVAEKELDTLGLTKIGEPVPGVHAFGPNDQVVAEVPDGLQKVLRFGLHVAMESFVTFGIEDAQVHSFGV